MIINPRKRAILPGDQSALANQLYKPATDAEFRVFMMMWCRHCVVIHPCAVAVRALELDTYQVEWRHDAEGIPECTAFK